MNQDSPLVPLCVDMDGTLIHTDLLLETFLLLVKRNPVYLLLIPFWLIQGKAVLKAEIAKRIALDPAALPYNVEFIDWINKQKQTGRALWLCTASNVQLAQRVADYLQGFQGIVASSDLINMQGATKAQHLVDKFGEQGFDYCGNDRADLAIWSHCKQIVVVNGSKKLNDQAAQLAKSGPILSFARKGGSIKSILKAMRLHQWAKNVLIFVPLAAAHKIGAPLLFGNAIMAFFAFGLCASSVYLLNDMLDLEADRRHPRKRLRPFASGDLSILVGFALIPILLTGTILFCCMLPLKFVIVLGSYYALTLAYSFGLKSVVMVDAISLAGLYTLRIIAGSKAIDVPLSFWLLLFSIFLFLSLAIVKRYAELDDIRRQGKLKAAGRGYHVGDLPVLLSMGTSAGYLCVLVLALYINSPAIESLYRQPKIIWLLCVLLLFWISRVWLIAQRGEMHDDPVIFAMKDKTSLAIAALGAVTIMLAT